MWSLFASAFCRERVAWRCALVHVLYVLLHWACDQERAPLPLVTGVPLDSGAPSEPGVLTERGVVLDTGVTLTTGPAPEPAVKPASGHEATAGAGVKGG